MSACLEDWSKAAHRKLAFAVGLPKKMKLAPKERLLNREASCLSQANSPAFSHDYPCLKMEVLCKAPLDSLLLNDLLAVVTSAQQTLLGTVDVKLMHNCSKSLANQVLAMIFLWKRHLWAQERDSAKQAEPGFKQATLCVSH